MSATKPALEQQPSPAPVHFQERPTPQERPPLRPARAPVGGRWVQFGYVLVDATWVCLNTFVVLAIRFSGETPDLLSAAGLTGWLRLGYGAYLVLSVALVVLACQGMSLYRADRSRTYWAETLAVARAVLIATALMATFLYLSGDRTISRIVVVFGGVLNFATLAAWRMWKRQFIERRVAQGRGARKVVIIGAGRVGQALADYLDQHKYLGYAVVGFLDQNHSQDPRLLGRIEDLIPIAQTHYVDEVFITIPSERQIVKRVAAEARQHRMDVKVVPDFYDGLGWNVPIRHVGQFPVMELHREPIPFTGLMIKRLMDLAGSALALLSLAPLLVLIALGIRLDSPGPVIYRSRRMGRKGRAFTCYKFRTMVANADALKEELLQRNERTGPFFKMSNDPRITRLGRVLRKYSLDELPQFWNVLIGDMSLVGPRPHPIDEYERYTLEHRRRLDVKPGVTGLWQITARRDPSFDTNMTLDLRYIENWTLAFDLRILLRTFAVVARGDGE